MFWFGGRVIFQLVVMKCIVIVAEGFSHKIHQQHCCAAVPQPQQPHQFVNILVAFRRSSQPNWNHFHGRLKCRTQLGHAGCCHGCGLLSCLSIMERCRNESCILKNKSAFIHGFILSKWNYFLDVFWWMHAIQSAVNQAKKRWVLFYNIKYAILLFVISLQISERSFIQSVNVRIPVAYGQWNQGVAYLRVFFLHNLDVIILSRLLLSTADTNSKSESHVHNVKIILENNHDHSGHFTNRLKYFFIWPHCFYLHVFS